MKNMDYGKDYEYFHSFMIRIFLKQEYLPCELSGNGILRSWKNAREEELRKYLRGSLEREV